VKALIFNGRGLLALEERPDPQVVEPADAVVRLTTASICGTDLHILRGDVASVAKGRVLGHEGVGIVEQVGTEVRDFKVGDRVLISVITSCGRCEPCRRRMPSHCRNGGWLLGNTVDGTQAERVRVPFADNGLHHLEPAIADDAAILLSCNFPTALECGTLAAEVRPGDRVAIVGAGPVGLATLMTCQLFSPGQLLVVDTDDHRLEAARALGATDTISLTGAAAATRIYELTDGQGVNAAIEAVGLPATFDLCQTILSPGGRLANVGVHGEPVSLKLESLWANNLNLTTRLVDALSTPALLKMVQKGTLQPQKLVTHRFAFGDTLKAYSTFGNAAHHQAIKIILEFSAPVLKGIP
jgi:alcohol dehydrogenase